MVRTTCFLYRAITCTTAVDNHLLEVSIDTQQDMSRAAGQAPSFPSAPTTSSHRQLQSTGRPHILRSEVDEILLPFFQHQPFCAGSSRTSPVPGSAPAAGVLAGTTGEHPLGGEGMIFDHHEGISEDERGFGFCDTGVGLGGHGSERRFHPEGAEELCLADAPGDITQDISVLDPPLIIPSAIPRVGPRAKRVRFTGALGEFLDGSDIWNDLRTMEVESRANQNAAAGAADIQMQSVNCDLPRQQQQQVQKRRPDPRVQHGQKRKDGGGGGGGAGEW